MFEALARDAGLFLAGASGSGCHRFPRPQDQARLFVDSGTWCVHDRLSGSAQALVRVAFVSFSVADGREPMLMLRPRIALTGSLLGLLALPLQPAVQAQEGPLQGLDAYIT